VTEVGIQVVLWADEKILRNGRNWELIAPVLAVLVAKPESNLGPNETDIKIAV
jgi:hypothetical protein